MPWFFTGRKERLRREASAWLVRLNGEPGASDREAFERWYRASPDHAAVYDRLKARWGQSGLLAESGLAQAPVLESWPDRRRRRMHFAFAGAMAVAVLIVAVLLGTPLMRPRIGPPEQIAAFDTKVGETRKVVLADGSLVELSPSSLLRVALTERERRLTLDHGEARFAVAHEERRFVVAAGTAEVVAHGTVFVVRLEGGRARVSLLQGVVDVSYGGSPTRPGERRVRRMRPGEQLIVAVQPPVPAPKSEVGGAASPAGAMLEFDDTPLAEAIDRANRYGGARLRLAHPALGSLRVTGAFRAGDPRSFAEALAAAFDLEVAPSVDGSLVLRARPASPR